MPVQTAKLILASLGLLLFFVGVKTQLNWIRWTGLALVAVSYLLRFYRPRVPASDVTTRVEEQ